MVLLTAIRFPSWAAQPARTGLTAEAVSYTCACTTYTMLVYGMLNFALCLGSCPTGWVVQPGGYLACDHSVNIGVKMLDIAQVCAQRHVLSMLAVYHTWIGGFPNDLPRRAQDWVGYLPPRTPHVISTASHAYWLTLPPRAAAAARASL